jgi:hypothetical protein
VHADVGQTAHAVVVRRNLCQAGLTVTFCALSLSDLLFMEGDDVQPPSTTLITAFSGLGKAWSTLLLRQCGGLSLATVASLDCYEGVRPANMDEDLTGGRWCQQCGGEMRGVEVEALGGGEWGL